MTFQKRTLYNAGVAFISEIHKDAMLKFYIKSHIKFRWPASLSCCILWI